MSEDSATNNTVLTFLTAGDEVDFTINNSCREILGFDSRLAPLTPQSAGWSEYSDNNAKFNRVNSYAIRSNIVSEGIPINNTSAGMLASIPITTTAGRQIIYTPQNATKINCDELIGQSKSNFDFSLVDQELRPTPTLGEYYSFILTFRYGILLTDKKVPMLQM